MAALLTVASVWLHWTFREAAGALWRDEVSSVNVAMFGSLSELWTLTTRNSNPVLHPLLLRLAHAASPGLLGDAGLRALGLVGGTLGLAGLWWAGLATRGGPPVLALALFGLNGAAVAWGDSVRPYGLGVLATAAHFALTWRLSSRPGRGAFWAAAAAAAASVNCLYQNVALVGAVALAGAFAARRGARPRAARLCLLSLLPAAASALAYAPLVGASREWLALVAEAGPSTVLPYLLVAVGAPSIAPAAAWLAALFGGLTLGVAALARPSAREFDPGRADLSAFAGGALALSFGYFVLFAVTGFATGPWNFVPFLALVALCVEAMTAGLAEPLRRWRPALAVLAGLSLFGNASAVVRTPLSNMDAAAKSLNAEARPGDLVVVNPWFYAISFRRYYAGAAPWTTVPPIDDFTVHRYDLVRGRMAEADPMRPVLEAARRTLEGGGSVWLLGTIDLYEEEAPPARPAPDPEWGWRELPYVNNWTWRLGYLLHRLGGEPQVVIAPARRSRRWELVPLLRVPGRGPGFPERRPARRQGPGTP